MIKKQFAFYRLILVFITLAFTLLVFGCSSITDTEEITLSQSSVELDVGEDTQITATLKIDKTGELTWASDKPQIATVENGLIEGISAGETFITVSYKDISARIEVTVYAVPDYTISINKGDLELYIGDEETLTATISPFKAGIMSWVSDKPNIANVVNGKISAISEGFAVITVSLDDLSATINVTVTKPTITDLELALDNSKYVSSRMKLTTTAKMMKEVYTQETFIDIDWSKTHTHSFGPGYELEQYATLRNNKIYSAIRAKSRNEWSNWEVYVSEYSTVGNVDFSTFSKDDFEFVGGYFELKDDKINEYLESIELFEDINGTIDSFDLKIKLKDNYVRKMIFEVIVSQGNVSSSITMEYEISNIGNTKVVIPDEVIKLFDAHK